MKAPQTPKRDDDQRAPALGWEQRYVEARVERVLPDALELRFGSPETEARLHKRNMDANLIARLEAMHRSVTRGEVEPTAAIQYGKHGDVLSVFLLHKSRQFEGWLVSQRWGTKERNPWDTRHDISQNPQCLPTVGATIHGIVQRYIGSYAAIVDIEDADGQRTGIEAFIHRANILRETDYRPIHEILVIGDRIGGRVASVERSKLHVEIEIAPLVKAKTEAAEVLRHSVKDSNEPESADTVATTIIAEDPELLSDVRLLIVDDDLRFARDLDRILTPWGARVECVDDPDAYARHIRRASEEQLPNRVLLDREFPKGVEAWSDCLKQTLALRKRVPNVAVAYCTANALFNPEPEAQIGAAVFVKPVDLGDLVAWLRSPTAIRSTAPRPYLPEAGSLAMAWRNRPRDLDFPTEAAALLKHICAASRAAGSALIERIGPGRYEVAAQHGLETQALHEIEPILNETLIDNVFDSGIDGQRVNFGALAAVTPRETVAILGLTLAPANADGALLLCLSSDTPPSPALRELFRQTAVQLFAKRDAQAAYNEEQFFASLGRYSTAYAHEARYPLALMMQAVAKLLRRANDPTLSDDPSKGLKLLREELKSLNVTVRQAEFLARQTLTLTQRHGVSHLPFVSVMRQLIGLARSHAEEAVHGGRPPLLTFDCAVPETRIELEPAALRQPLLNLLSNAVYQTTLLGAGGHVNVRVALDFKEPQWPLSIFVTDNGAGIDAEQQRHLFRPRTSTRGEQGVGMGLYIAAQLAAQAGGVLRLRDTARFLGSTFELRLPWRPILGEVA